MTSEHQSFNGIWSKQISSPSCLHHKPLAGPPHPTLSRTHAGVSEFQWCMKLVLKPHSWTKIKCFQNTKIPTADTDYWQNSECVTQILPSSEWTCLVTWEAKQWLTLRHDITTKSTPHVLILIAKNDRVPCTRQIADWLHFTWSIDLSIFWVRLTQTKSGLMNETNIWQSLLIKPFLG